MSTPLKIFIIYAREDKLYKDDLLKSLKLLQTQGLIEHWHDGDIKPGDEWDKEIKAQLQTAHVILPIISFDFFNSDYIHRVEIVEAFQRYERGEVIIIPIIADSCPWTDYPRLRDFQALPAEGKPIDDWSNRKNAMTSIYDGVKRIILERKGKMEKAAAERRKAAEPFYNLAYKATDNLEKIKYYSKAIELDHQYFKAFFQRGYTRNDLAQFEEAIKDYDQAIRINPNHATSYNNRGYAKINLKQYEEAIKDFDQCIDIDPNDALAYNNRGNAKYGLTQYKEAIKDYDQAIRIDPNYAMAYDNRGSAKKNLNLLNEAQTDYKKALAIDPNYVSAKNHLKELKEELK